jgi:hypothetical protein
LYAMPTGKRDVRARTGPSEINVPITPTGMRRSARYGGMIVDAELLWIVIATSGTKSLTVLALIVDEFGIERIGNSSFFYSLKASRLQTTVRIRRR